MPAATTRSCPGRGEPWSTWRASPAPSFSALRGGVAALFSCSEGELADESDTRTAVNMHYDPSTVSASASPSPPRMTPKASADPPYLGLVRDPRFTFMTRGVILGSPHYDSPAAKAGIKVSDMLMRFNGVPINAWRDYKAALARCHPGQTVKVEVGRLNQPLSFEVTLTAGKEDD